MNQVKEAIAILESEIGSDLCFCTFLMDVKKSDDDKIGNKTPELILLVVTLSIVFTMRVLKLLKKSQKKRSKKIAKS